MARLERQRPRWSKKLFRQLPTRFFAESERRILCSKIKSDRCRAAGNTGLSRERRHGCRVFRDGRRQFRPNQKTPRTKDREAPQQMRAAQRQHANLRAHNWPEEYPSARGRGKPQEHDDPVRLLLFLREMMRVSGAGALRLTRPRSRT